MDCLKLLWENANKLSMGWFVQHYAGLYLIGVLPSAEVIPQSSFETLLSSNLANLSREQASSKTSQIATPDFLLRVQKSSRNPFKDRISIGRAGNCDLVVPHPSVSKLHAHLVSTTGSDFSSPPGSSLAVIDAKSRNGTLCNGQLVLANKPSSIKPGDHLQFGFVHTEMLTAASVFRLLHAKALKPNGHDKTS